MTVPRQKTRRGYSLIELMTVISVVGVLLGLCALTVQLLLRVSSDARDRSSTSASLGRLAERFREDVHSSHKADVEQAARLRLSIGSGPAIAIAYEAKSGRIDRVQSRDGTVVARESFALGRRATARFESRDDDPGRFVALVVIPDTRAGSTDSSHPLEILARVKIDRPPPAPEKGGSR